MRKYIIIIVFPVILGGCQSYSEYYESQYKGQPLEERLKVKRTGVPSWSEGKVFQGNVSGAAIK